jgi:hypothetical protein
MSQSEHSQSNHVGLVDSSWNKFYKVAGIAALLALVVMVLEILITFLPGGARTMPDTLDVVDWYELFNHNAFMGLRNLGLMNIISILFGIPIYLALYGVHRNTNRAYALFAAVLYFIGLAVYISNNTAFSMFALSSKYATATTPTQKSLIVAAGESLLAQGESHTPGTFIGFFLCEIAGIAISVVMLHGRVFSRINAYTGIVGSGFLLLFDICSAFVPALFQAAMILVMIGGISSLVWYVLIAQKLFLLGKLNHIDS